ncbi:MAG: ABC transporter ATP-binding protein [Candidatus Sumerlaeota bacterium]|nr:ABC transporter ATP-binding protein [Candidatus Sumerlaeota bacterium]
MIRIKHFSKTFGDLKAVSDLTMTIGEKQICGFIGPNGAGKSTTIRFLATLSQATAGDARIAGHSVSEQPRKVRAVIGYMPEEFGVYDGMRVWEYLDFFGAAFNVKLHKRRKVISDVLELVDLTHKRDDLVQSLSRGMKQRLCLAKSLVHDPQVLILDEPASGLDPRARIEMKALLKEMRNMGKTILISSHILSELADLCDSVAIIERGKLLAFGALAEIAKTMREYRVLEIRLPETSPILSDMLHSHPFVSGFEEYGGLYTVNFTGDNNELIALNRQIIQAGVPLITLREMEANLEEMFMKITTGAVQ